MSKSSDKTFNLLMPPLFFLIYAQKEGIQINPIKSWCMQIESHKS
uniref:Uncharacterized protein n=1 Tax=Arundo donax TaxID=35708 RepID=A0A0A8YVH3_ARUDO